MFFSGGVCSWSVMKEKFSLCEGKYDVVSRPCGILNNRHIIHSPLSEVDSKKVTYSEMSFTKRESKERLQKK